MIMRVGAALGTSFIEVFQPTQTASTDPEFKCTNLTLIVSSDMKLNKKYLESFEM